MKKIILVLILCLSQVIDVSGQVVSSGKTSVLINNKPKPEVNQNKSPVSVQNTAIVQPAADPELLIGGGKYYALIIGISNYSDPLINGLDKPIKDAQTFFNTLTNKYTFEKDNVRFLKDATMAQIVDALDYFAKAIRPIDNFLIFYAGHGVWDAASEIGFWLPSDARKNSKLAWFRNST
ncbi:MAG: caspase family protein, partial [Bacteroidia bacterium]|nr:caspase family protein [Bacteroidia bacterium]